MPTDLDSISIPAPCWTVAAYTTHKSEEAITNHTIETHRHYGAARAFRRLRSLYQKYRTEPRVWVEMIAPDGTHTTAEHHSPALLAAAGRKGGTATAAKRTPAQRSTFARRAAIARWSKLNSTQI